MSLLKNIFFVGVARTKGDCFIVASYSYNNSEIDINGVKQVLEQPNTVLQPGKHYSFQVADASWNLMSDEQGLTYIAITAVNYPARCAHACLEEFQKGFSPKFGQQALRATHNALTGSCRTIMKDLCVKYDNLAEVDKIAALGRKVENVQLVMQENIEIALQNCVKTESIERQAEELHQQAGMFSKQSKTLRNVMWWRNMKMKLLIGGVIIVVLTIIITVIACQVSTCS